MFRTVPPLTLSPPQECSRKIGGFALVISLSLMAFILVLLLALTSFIQVESKNSTRTLTQLEARQNAMLALQMAIGQLQKTAGPDQRISARADINTSNTGNPNWIGIWDARAVDPSDPTQLIDSSSALEPSHATAPANNEPLVWLVNGAEDVNNGLSPDQPAVADPSSDNENIWLVQNLLGQSITESIKLQTSPIDESGNYAYWVDDLGIKASVQLTSSTPAPASGSDEHVQQLTTAPTFGSELISGFSDLFQLVHSSSSSADDFQQSLERVVFYDQLENLSAAGDRLTPENMAANFANIDTIGSYGVLADTLRGGLRRDLSYVLNNNTGLNTSPIATEVGSGVRIPFGNKDSNGFDRLPTPGPVGEIAPQNSWTGSEEVLPPTWDLVRSFLSNRPNSSGAMDPVAAPFPVLDNWNIEPSATHAILPIVTMVEFRFGMDISGANYSYAIEPNIVLCNPYNVTLNAADYSVVFTPIYSSAPSIPFTISPTTPAQSIPDLSFATHLGSSELAFNITDSLAPGEVKIYSLPADTFYNASSGGVISLSPGYSAASILIDTGVAIDPTLTASSTSKIELQEISQFHPKISLAVGHASAGNLPVPSITARYIETEPKRMDIKYDKDSPSTKQTKPFARMDGSMDPRTLITFRLSMTTPSNGYLTSGNQPGAQNHQLPGDHPARRSDGGTVSEVEAGMRSLIDSNPRAVISQRLGGWDNTPLYHFDSYRDADYTIPVSFDLIHAYWGGSIEGDGNGTSQVVLFDIPRANDPITSMGQLAQVNWGTGGKHPTYPLGNSYASIFYNANTPDFSFALNEALWDRFFFSTLPSTGLGNRPDELANTRLDYYDPQESTDLSALEGNQAYQLAASRLLIKGAFNINSTSVAAWTAFLGSIPLSDYAYELPLSGANTIDTDVRPYLRLRRTHGMDPTAHLNELYEWSGYRDISDDQIRAIADEVVNSIRQRGRPARSLAEFLNRDLNYPSDDTRNQKGILQAAIDTVMNQDDPTLSSDGQNALNDLPGIVGAPSLSNALIVEAALINADNPDAARGKLRATGAPGFVMQNDLITPLAPAMSARSDTFRIRTYGDARNSVTGKVSAKIWCEAYVQRVPEYVGGEAPETQTADLTAGSISDQFGRRFVVTHVRWLTENDI